MAYAVIDNGAYVSTAEEMPNGGFKITIDSKEYLTNNLELWATECGYTLLDIEDMEINPHPMYTFFVEGADLDAIEIDPPPAYRLVSAAGDRVILGFDHGGSYTQLTFVATSQPWIKL